MAKPALVVSGSDAKWELKLDVRQVTDAIGADVLADFYRLFVAADRIVALEQLLVLNNDAMSRDSVGSERNMHHLVMLLASAMYEAGDALQGLTSSKFGQTLQTLERWPALDKLRKEWNTAAFAGKVRNNLGHHFGEHADYVKGIAAGPDHAVIETGEGPRLHQSRVMEPVEALFRALDLQLDNFGAFVKKVREAHVSFPSLVRELFHEVLVSYELIS